MDKYAGQDRGNLSEYEEYFAGMDASMQQKIALTTAHFPSRGLIADMGSGSGSGTFDLARLYKNLELVGVDINPVTVEYSQNHYKAENLKFEVGDIAENVFAENTLDGILDSSVLHHVTSFNGFDAAQITKTLKNQVAQLKTGGVLIIRDFVVPDEAGKQVYIDLPNDDGKDSGKIPELSTAALFEIFARDFRSSLNLNSSVPYRKTDSPKPDFTRFQTSLRSAAEFVLRKDYRDHWSPELLEEYCYFSQKDFEENFRKENLRIVVSMPLWNPWIVENRFRKKFYLSDSEGNDLTFPPTNYLIVGEKVKDSDGVQLAEVSALADARASASIAYEKPGVGKGTKSFLNLKFYRNKQTAQIYELAERPNQTIDLLPWFENENGQILILAKKDFPRPIINADNERKNLNCANYSGYLTEPISAIWDFGFGISDLQNSKTETRRAVFEILNNRAELAENEILEIGEPQFYYTSAGGIDERAASFLVKISPFEKQPHEIENYTQFKSAGFVRELDALQVLRASHVGGMFDARLEISIYRLLRRLNRSASAWIGAAVSPTTQFFSGKIETGFEVENRKGFEEIGSAENSFLKLCKSEFIETDSAKNIISRAEFEYVVPKNFSKNTVAAIPFIKTENEILVGIETRDLPAPQNFSDSSQLFCVPAWRLPFSIEHKFEIENFLRERFPKDFKVSLNKTWELGGSYFTSAGITPETVYPFAVELDAKSLSETDLKFFHLNKLLENSEKIQDAHLLILLNRFAHSLGELTAK
ncbi:MAG: methyltransferase domain-containing protein [Pyrinomonadaceae bacterium]|nr:methyltransferase domain-containing protein [Pyrinomonadaceae bacterium]